MANCVYLIGDETSRLALVVDPAWEVPAILAAVEAAGYRLAAALLTHNHFDHVNGVEELLRAADIPVYVHREDASAVPAGRSLKPVADGDSMSLGGLEVGFLHTPGHTAGSQCLKVEGRLLTGDTLFIDGCGRVDLPTSDPERMGQSLRKLAALPPETEIWPGHGYSGKESATLKSQLLSNPYLKAAALGLPDFLRLIGS